MARLEHMAEKQRDHLNALDCTALVEDKAFVSPRRLNECNVALISSAGLMQRSDDNVPGNSAGYRAIDNSCPDRDILLNHLSVNFDRTAFAEDINTVFPREAVAALAADKIINKAAKTHYSFMGATQPAQFQPHVEQLAVELKAADINTVCLLPV